MTTIDIYYISAQVVGAAFAFGLGLTKMKSDAMVVPAIAAGILTTLAIQVPAGGGPGLFVGLFVLPIMFIILACLGRGFRSVLRWAGLLRSPKNHQ